MDRPGINATRLGMPSRRAALAAVSAVAVATFLQRTSSAATTAVRQDIDALAKQSDKLATLEGAIREMQARSDKDPNDPKGWRVNADAHKAFCAIPANVADQVHFCWWFLPWHRAYLVVTERKLRELAKDDSLALPYWNWSVDRGIPSAYSRAASPLAKARRFTPTRPLNDSEVDYFPNDPDRRRLGVAALEAKKFEAASAAEISAVFGGIARPNRQGRYGNNRLEGTPHGPIHNYVGGADPLQGEGDMTDFATAGLDPIFFAHHANLDRLWENWRSVNEHRKTEPTTDAFLKHEFPFVWLDGTTTTVTGAETLDTQNLGYMYDDLAVMKRVSSIVIAQSAQDRLPPVASQSLTVPLLAQSAGTSPRLYLEISGVEKPPKQITIGVFVKPADADPDEAGENVGAFAAVKAGGEVAWPNDTFVFDITDAAKRLAGRPMTVELVPFRIQSAGTETYPRLSVGAWRITSER